MHGNLIMYLSPHVLHQLCASKPALRVAALGEGSSLPGGLKLPRHVCTACMEWNKKKSAQYFVLLFVFSLRKSVKRTVRSLEKRWLGAAQEVTRKRGLVALCDATVSVHWETPVLLCSCASETPVSLEVYLLLILTQSQRWNKDSYLKACVVMVYERLT